MEQERTKLIHRALIYEWITVVWNVFEGIIAISAGVWAGSIALVGFGLDSFIEVTAAGALIWRLRKHGSENPDEESQAERTALRIVGITFFLLAAYVGYESIHALWTKEAPRESFIGILLAIVSSLVMPFLALMKRKVARQLESKALEADATETMVCSLLSIALLAGLGLNAWLGWWWADPAAGLVMVGFIFKEGWETFEEAGEKRENNRENTA